MKLDSKKNLIIYQKSLYAEQLYYYSKMCLAYSKLSKLHQSFQTALDVENYYQKPLAAATAGNLIFSSLGNFTEEEIEIFNEYATYAKNFKDFKEISNIVSEVLKNE